MINADHGKVAHQEQPRFLLAIQQYEQFLLGAEVVGDIDERAQYFSDLMTACGGLSIIAQNYDFASTNPDLADTEAVAVTGQALATELLRPDIPDEVKAIYLALYDDLHQYATPDELDQTGQ